MTPMRGARTELGPYFVGRDDSDHASAPGGVEAETRAGDVLDEAFELRLCDHPRQGATEGPDHPVAV